MTKRAPQKPEISQQIARPVRQWAIKLLKARLKSIQSREELAIKLGKSLDSIQDLFSREKGGFDLIVAALMVAYGVDEAGVDQVLEKLEQILPTVSQSEKRWRDLPLDEQTRIQIITAIEMTIAATKS